MIREGADGSWVWLTEELIVAQHAGQAAGSAYRYVDFDPDLDDGGHRYILEVVTMDGAVEWLDIDVVLVTGKIYLPLITR